MKRGWRSQPKTIKDREATKPAMQWGVVLSWFPLNYLEKNTLTKPNKNPKTISSLSHAGGKHRLCHRITLLNGRHKVPITIFSVMA